MDIQKLFQNTKNIVCLAFGLTAMTLFAGCSGEDVEPELPPGTTYTVNITDLDIIGYNGFTDIDYIEVSGQRQDFNAQSGVTQVRYRFYPDNFGGDPTADALLEFQVGQSQNGLAEVSAILTDNEIFEGNPYGLDGVRTLDGGMLVKLNFQSNFVDITVTNRDGSFNSATDEVAIAKSLNGQILWSRRNVQAALNQRGGLRF